MSRPATGPATPVREGAAVPGRAASRWRMLLAQTAMELRLTGRRGESLLLTLIIPVGLLAFFAAVPIGGAGIGFLTPGVLALAVMSTAFTGQAIATGYERSYGVLRRLGATPLPRSVLLAGKTLAVLAVEVVQVVVVVLTGLALGWHPHGDPALVVLGVALATAAFSGLALLLAGTLRAEATLAAANGLYLVFLLLGGVVFPLTRLPGALRSLAQLLPTGALSQLLRGALSRHPGLAPHDVVVLAVWGVAALVAAARTFRWE